MSKSRNYCDVDGCTSQKTNENLSFFKLPKEEERRNRWLEVIGRPDLLTSSTKHNCHYVCSLHFEKSMIKNIPQLKADAVPTKLLPKGPSTFETDTNTEYKDTCTQTKESFIESTVNINKGLDTKSSYVQTESKNVNNEVSQTSQAPSSDTPRKRSNFYEEQQKITEPEEVTLDVKVEYYNDEEDDWTDPLGRIIPETIHTLPEQCNNKTEELSNDSQAKRQKFSDTNKPKEHTETQMIHPGDSSRNATRIEDTYESFGQYISSLLRSLPPEKALRLQPKIVKMIVDGVDEEVERV